MHNAGTYSKIYPIIIYLLEKPLSEKLNAAEWYIEDKIRKKQ